jgi:acetoin utilization deacetylase AcuC-like enzyme
MSLWKPTWLLISAGFDGHRADPLTDLGLSSGDYADLTTSLAQLVPEGRLLLFLEGGYDLDALADCTGAVLSALVDEGAFRPEPATAGGPGGPVCDAALNIRGHLADGEA